MQAANIAAQDSFKIELVSCQIWKYAPLLKQCAMVKDLLLGAVLSRDRRLGILQMPICSHGEP